MSGRPMRWAAGLVLALGAGTVAAIAGPLWTADEYWFGIEGIEWEQWGALSVYASVVILIATAVAALFLRIDLVGAREALATRMALGESRTTLLREAGRSGARLGGAWGLIGIAGGLALQQFWTATTVASDDWSLAPEVLAWSLATVLVVAAASALASLLATAAVTRGTPDAMVAASAAGVEVPRNRVGPTGRWHRVAGAVPVATMAAGGAVFVVNRIAPVSTWTGAPGWSQGAVTVALTIVAVCAVWWSYRLLSWGSERVVRGASALLRRGSEVGGRAFAADGLRRPTETRRRALAVIAVIAALWAWTWGVQAQSDAENDASLALDATAVITSVDPWNGVGLPTGLNRIALDDAVVAAISADPALTVIPARMVIEEPEEIHLDNEVTVTPRDYQAFSLAIDRAEADAVAPGAYRELGLAAGVRVEGRDEEYLPRDAYVPGSTTGPGVITTWAGATPIFTMWSQAPLPTVDAAWARDVWGEAPVSALLVFSSAGTDQQFGMPNPSTLASLASHIPDGKAFVLTPDENAGWIDLGGNPLGSILGAVGVVLVVLLSAGVTQASVRSRRREFATFAALGATPRALRAAPVWEALVVATAATVVGTVLGVAVAAVAGNPFLLAAGAPFDLSEIGWHLWHDVAAVPWTTLLSGVGLVVVTTGAIAWWMGRGMASGSPVEELREAEREGVR